MFTDSCDAPKTPVSCCLEIKDGTRTINASNATPTREHGVDEPHIGFHTARVILKSI